MGVRKVVPGNQLILPPCDFTPPKGKAFAGWDVNGATCEADKPAQIIGNTNVKALWTDAWPLWVGGVQVTALNQKDILGDGTAVYSGDDSRGRLTLSGAVITGGRSYAGIYSDLAALTIAVSEDSAINVSTK